MEILTKIVEHIENDNPYGLIFKGGTALSLLHLDHHRESEDLDFDMDEKYLENYKDIQKYFQKIFEDLKKQNIIQDYRIGKSGLASTNRFHMKIQFILHRPFQTKLDIDFVKSPVNLKQKGKLFYYSFERMFISKVITFTARREFKDFIDIAFMLPKVDFNIYDNKLELSNLLQKLIDTINERSLIERYNFISKNVDLKIKGMRRGDINKMIVRTFRDIRATINVLKH
jgi:predicted nucleotidyltransferase component of viral defense system